MTNNDDDEPAPPPAAALPPSGAAQSNHDPPGYQPRYQPGFGDSGFPPYGRPPPGYGCYPPPGYGCYPPPGYGYHPQPYPPVHPAYAYAPGAGHAQQFYDPYALPYQPQPQQPPPPQEPHGPGSPGVGNATQQYNFHQKPPPGQHPKPAPPAPQQQHGQDQPPQHKSASVEETNVLKGRFFTTLGSVWGVGFKEYEKKNWDDFHRMEPVKVSVRRKNNSRQSVDQHQYQYQPQQDHWQQQPPPHQHQQPHPLAPLQQVLQQWQQQQQQQQQREKDDIQNGRFFTKLGSVWGVGFKEYEKKNWDDFHRMEPVKVSVRTKNNSRQRVDPYSATIEKINSENDGPAKAESTRVESDASTVAKKQIWPVDISGEELFNPNTCQVAHLLPAGKKEHQEWFGVGAAVLGIPQTVSTKMKLMATRGVKMKRESSNELDDGIKQEEDSKPAAHAPASGGVQDDDSKLGTGAPASGAVAHFTEETNTEPPTKRRKLKERFDHTGVVHFVSNKIRMKAQGTYLNGRAPLSLLVPCLTLEEARKWKGEAYKAVYLAGLPNGYPAPEAYNSVSQIPDYEKDTGFGTEEFYARYVEARAAGELLDEPHQVTELEKARKLLEDAVLGLSQYVKSLENLDLEGLDPDKQMELKKRGKELGREAPIPTKVKDPTRPVLFVQFGPQEGGTANPSHPAPDPLLLVAKAGSVWGRMTAFYLLTSAEEPPGEEEDSLDRLAEEAWLFRHRSKPDTPVPMFISVS